MVPPLASEYVPAAPAPPAPPTIVQRLLMPHDFALDMLTRVSEYKALHYNRDAYQCRLVFLDQREDGTFSIIDAVAGGYETRLV